jgi:hypothetical protein
MRNRTFVTLAAAACLAAAAAVPASAPVPPVDASVVELEGAGWLSRLACGACVGTYVATAALGLGPIYNGLLAVNGGALADACVLACTS